MFEIFKKKKKQPQPRQPEPVQDDEAKQAALENAEIINEHIADKLDYIEQNEQMIEKHLREGRRKDAEDLAEDVYATEQEIEELRAETANYMAAAVAVRMPYTDRRLAENNAVLGQYFGQKLASNEKGSDKYRGFVQKFGNYRRKKGIHQRVTKGMSTSVKRASDGGKLVLARIQARIDSTPTGAEGLEEKVKKAKGEGTTEGGGA